MGMSMGWEDRAESWLAWARTPGHDSYWLFREAFFELVPEPDGTALEVGCGEGRVCRDLRSRGWDAVGLDASETLRTAAAEADPDGTYVLGTAEALPFPEGSFALVVAYNSLMDVDDMPRTVSEIARVLRAGGRFAACVTHPFRDVGSFEADEDGEVFVVRRPYLEEGVFEGTFTRDGLTMRFDGRTHPVESYARALEDAGFLIEALREPVGFDARDRRMPQFLLLRAVKP